MLHFDSFYSLGHITTTLPHALSLEEALLLHFENHPIDTPSILFWDTPELGVVLGHSRPYERDINVATTVDDSVSIHRRISGGGTILHGPGCLSYSLFIPIAYSSTLTSIQHSNTAIMAYIVEQLNKVHPGAGFEVKGCSDITLDNLKCAGHAQIRKRHMLLFHGTLLLSFDLLSITRYLTIPDRQPAYRKNRTHQDFLTNAPLSTEQVISCFPTAPSPLAIDSLHESTHSIMGTRHNDKAWLKKF